MRSRKNRSTADNKPAHTGRFAPSPTGPLHLGSLICAVASYLDARNRNGRWLIRMEDLDPPRETVGAATAILHSLEAHGLHWDGEVLWQSRRHPAYRRVIDELLATGDAFYCHCSRAQLARAGNIYQGHCLRSPPIDTRDCAIRLRLHGDTLITIRDALQQGLSQDLTGAVGDFVIRRRDGLYAYQLAVVVDDHMQGVTHIVRGSDLYDSTPRQVYLLRLLGMPEPAYCHIPVITNARGHKLSKQTHASPLDDAQALRNLRLALKFLGQSAPDPGHSTAGSVLEEAATNWQLEAVSQQLSIPESTLY